MNEDHFNFSGRDWRDLSPQQWTEARRDVVLRAHRMRALAIKSVLLFLTRICVRGVRVAVGTYVNWRTARIERNAIARLQSLDDHALSDIGIRRSEIESVVQMDGRDKTRRHGGNRPMAA